MVTSLAKVLSGEPLPRLPVIKDPELDKYHRDVNEYLRRLMGKFTNAIINSSPDLRITMLNGFIEAPLVKAYTLVEYAEYGFELTRITHKTLSGGCTISVRINGTPATGTGDTTPSAVQGTYTFTMNQTVVVGDRVTLNVTAISSPVDFAFTLDYLRANV